MDNPGQSICFRQFLFAFILLFITGAATNTATAQDLSLDIQLVEPRIPLKHLWPEPVWPQPLLQLVCHIDFKGNLQELYVPMRTAWFHFWFHGEIESPFVWSDGTVSCYPELAKATCPCEVTGYGLGGEPHVLINTATETNRSFSAELTGADTLGQYNFRVDQKEARCEYSTYEFYTFEAPGDLLWSEQSEPLEEGEYDACVADINQVATDFLLR